MTITARYATQYRVSFDQSGSAVNPQVTYSIDGGAPLVSTIPFGVWAYAGAEVDYTYSATVPGASGVQYALSSASPASPLEIDFPTAVTGTYVTQYQMKVSYSTSDDTTPTSNIVFRGVSLSSPVTVTLSKTEQAVWLDQNTYWDITYQVASGSQQWKATAGISGTMSGPMTIIPEYYHQYYVPATFSTSDGSVPSVTVEGYSLGVHSFYPLSAPPQNLWLDAETNWYVNSLIPASPTTERWIAIAGTTGTVTSTTVVSPYYYHQLSLTFQYTIAGSPTGSPTNPTVSIMKFGSPAPVTALQVSPPSDWVDYGSAVTYPAALPGSSMTERWFTSTTSFAATAVGTTLNPTYYHQYFVTAMYSTSDGVVPSTDDVFLSGTSLGSISSYIVRTYAAVWLDAGSSWNVNSQLPASPTTERWITTGGTSGTVDSSNTISLLYYHQFRMTLSYSVVGGSSGSSPPSFTARQFGSSASQGLTTTATGYWFDATYSWSVTNPLGGSGATERWFTPQAVSGTISAAATLNFNYVHQYQISFASNPVEGGTTNPSGSNFYGAGMVIPISALANPTYTFASWSGGLSSSANPANLTVNAPLQVTANFVLSSQIGITVKNYIEDIPPDTVWSYLIVDLNTHTVVENFTLPASGGSLAFPSLGVTGGDYSVTEIEKFGYTTSMEVNGVPYPTSHVNVHPGPGGFFNVTFINSAMPAFATQYISQAPPSDLNVQLPALKPVPVQSAWSVDISGNAIVDLVLGKPMAVLVNLAGVTLSASDQVTVSVSFEGQQYSKTFSATDLGQGAIVGFSPIVPATAGTKDITGNYKINSGNPVALTPTSVTVKTTNSLSLYFAYLSKSSYGSVTQAAFDLMAQNSVAFLNATYPIKNATVNIVYSGKSIAGSTKTGTTGMQADCVAVAAKAKSVMGTGAVGVAIGPNNTGLSDYFASFGKAGAAGVSFGTSTKGVVVLDGYYTAAAHEVAHTFGLYWGKPEQYQTDPPNGKASSGVWPTNGQWRTGYSFMGTAPYRTLDFSWVDDANTYRYLFNHTATNVADPEIVVVSGLIYKNGQVEILPDVPWYHFNQGTADTVPPGDYAIKFVDANGNTLNITSFAADFFMHIDPGTSVGEDQIDTSSYGMVPLDTASFVFAAEYPSGTAKIQVIDVTKPQTPLAEVTAGQLVQVGNTVTFTQSGMPTGTSWSVTLGGFTKSSTTNTITFTGVSSGSYTWSAMAQISGGTGIRYVTSLTSGTMNVPTQLSQSITYTTQYQVSFAVSPSGKGTVNPSTTAYYNAGSVVSISATAQSNYAFYSWNTNTPSITFASSSSASTTATINGAGTITATLGYLVSGNSNIDISGSNNVIIITGGNHLIDCRHATSTTILKIGKGNNIIFLGGGNNVVKETAGGNDAITGLDGNNDINIVADGNYAIITGDGDDKIQITGNGNSAILAGDGNNVITISGNGNNAITTGSGNDVVSAGDGNNLILTGKGDDSITVGKGNNLIDGGGGYDVCVHGNGHNTILNCEKK